MAQNHLTSYVDAPKDRLEKHERVQTFQFPEETRARNRWLRECNIDKKSLKKDARLCAKHFLENCFLPQSENLDAQGRGRQKRKLLGHLI